MNINLPNRKPISMNVANSTLIRFIVQQKYLYT